MSEWVTLKEFVKKQGKPRQTVIDMIKREGLETKKEEREVTQRQMVTLVKVKG